ncbi:hypothetical protein ACFFX1_53645 [Dactylosporangium sucinum]|uniref:Uncharacterized protein n=1 Tax=Dactylosporangium sucinum TaxID=1424081 RepID=A0A917X3K7_9ACTN|nr:hypothetical protein [Dactylosporangium sucinum]GGM61770.1 hypothetical protein GCM10007977_074050 [Dactylosporangium sucinum]
MSITPVAATLPAATATGVAGAAPARGLQDQLDQQRSDQPLDQRLDQQRLDRQRLDDQRQLDTQDALRQDLVRRDRQQADDLRTYQDQQNRLRQQRVQDRQRLDDQQRIQEQLQLEETLRQRAEDTRLDFERAADAIQQQRLQQTQSLFTGRLDVYL